MRPLELEPSGSDYLDAIRFRRVDADVAYYDPSAPPPPLETQQEPTAERQDGPNIDVISFNWPVTIVSLLVLAAVIFLFLRFGGGISVSLGHDADNPGRVRVRPRAGEGSIADAAAMTLDSILGLADRRLALIKLSHKALAVAVAANGLLFQRSWTARDALRRLPRDQAHLDPLNALVLAGERVQFGGRDVTEDEFDAHVRRIRPLFGTQGT